MKRVILKRLFIAYITLGVTAAAIAIPETANAATSGVDLLQKLTNQGYAVVDGAGTQGGKGTQGGSQTGGGSGQGDTPETDPDDDKDKDPATDDKDKEEEKEKEKEKDKDNKDDDEDPDEASDDEKSDAINRLSRYYKGIELANSGDLTREQLDKVKAICDEGRNAIAGSDIRKSELSDLETDTKKLMDDYVAACLKNVPSTTVDYLTVGNLYDIPVGTYGQAVNVLLPILNLGTEDLTNVIVTPVVSGNVSEFPFVITRVGFSQTIPVLKGAHSMDQAIMQRGELLWTFGIRDDVLDGFYKIEFDVVYHRKGEAEKAKISTYVRCVGAPGSASLEKGEGAKSSTPRIIVTGFSTEPEDVYAGSTFMLNINVKNVSQRTEVSNIQFDLKAAEEGKDNDTTYYAFLPTSGSNTIYVPILQAGQETELKIEMSAKADLVQKPYALDLSMKYEDDDYEAYESSTSISVPVKQLSRVEFSTPELIPDSIEVGSQSNLMFSVYNTGKTILYNVKVRFDDPAVSGGDAFLGKLDSGATGNVDVMITGENPSGGTVKGIVSYENDAGAVTETEFSVPLDVMEPLPVEDFGDMDPEMDQSYMEDQKPPLSVPVIAGSAVGGLVVIAVIVLIVRKIRKKKDSFDSGDL